MDSLKKKQFEAIKTIWENDINKAKTTYPKTIKDKEGLYTKKFLKYNQKLIKDKKTFYYLRRAACPRAAGSAPSTNQRHPTRVWLRFRFQPCPY